MKQNGFLYLDSLWITAPIVALLVVVLWRSHKNWKAGILHYQLKKEAWRGRVWLLPVLIVMLLAIAITRPYWGYKQIEETTEGRDILVAVDTSISMVADDVKPNRLQIARRQVFDIIDQLKKTSRGDRIGIILFSGTSYLFCPLTSDYSTARAFADSISTQMIS